MPAIKAIHLNPDNSWGISRCGKRLANVIWRSDPKDVTCNLCLRLIEKDKRLSD